MPLPIICPMCNVDIEHMVHVFFDCQFASQCWSYADLSHDMSLVEYASDWLIQKINDGTNDEICRIAIVLRGIWFGRNKKVWDNKFVGSSLAVDWSNKVVMDWRSAMASKNLQTNRGDRGVKEVVHRWKPPEEGNFKVNVDTSVCMEAGFCSIGMVLRDHTGLFLEGKNLRLACPESVFAAETIGMCEALSWIAEKELLKVTFESDLSLRFKLCRRDKIIIWKLVMFCRVV